MSTLAQLAQSGIAPNGIRGKGSQIINNIIAANGSLPLKVSGTQYYVLLATASIEIRPSGPGVVGYFDAHTAGTGKNLSQLNAFDMLEIKNTNAFPVVFSICVGWDDFIDKRLILATQQTPQVIYNTYDTPNSATSVDIDDLSGQAFTDINGNEWYALYRVAILAFNPDAGVTYFIQVSGSVVANGPAVGIVYPLTSLRLDASGDYTVNVGGGNVNAIISEIYAAIPAII